MQEQWKQLPSYDLLVLDEKIANILENCIHKIVKV